MWLIIVGLILISIAVYYMIFSHEKKPTTLVRTEQPIPGFNNPVTPRTEQNVQRVMDYYTPERGRLSSWWERGKGEGRVKLLTVLNEEQRLVIEQGAILERAAREDIKQQAEFQVFLARNAAVLNEIRVNEQLIENALKEGLTTDNHQRVLLEERLAAIALQTRWHEIAQDLDAADLLEISEQQLLKKLRGNLAELYREKYQISKGNDPPSVKKKLIARYDKDTKYLEELIDARQAGRILSKDKETARRLAKGTPESGADYPTGIDGDDI